MNQRSVGIIGLLILISTVSAQGEKRFHFGLTGSASVTSHWSPHGESDLYSVDTRFIHGWSAGISAEYVLSRRFLLQMECIHIQKGAVHDITIPGFFLGSMRADYRFQYLEIPVLLKTTLYKKGHFSLHTDGGVYAASVLSANYTLTNDFFGTIQQDLSAKEKQDLGFLFGAGVDVLLRGIRIGAGYRYSLGMVDVTLPTGPGMEDIGLRNQCYQFLISVVY